MLIFLFPWQLGHVWLKSDGREASCCIYPQEGRKPQAGKVQHCSSWHPRSPHPGNLADTMTKVEDGMGAAGGELKIHLERLKISLCFLPFQSPLPPHSITKPLHLYTWHVDRILRKRKLRLNSCVVLSLPRAKAEWRAHKDRFASSDWERGVGQSGSYHELEWGRLEFKPWASKLIPKLLFPLRHRWNSTYFMEVLYQLKEFVYVKYLI